MKFLKLAFFTTMLALSFHIQAAPIEGKEYRTLDFPQPSSSGNKIEVLEFFFYGCSHCYHFHPYISAWDKHKAKDVELILVPTIFNPNWEPMAYTYYALEAIGKQNEETHDALYKALNDKHMDLSDVEKISRYISGYGVDAKKFSDAYRSFGVMGKINRSKQLQQAYGIRGTPTVVVDGKYVIANMPPDDTLRVLNELIEKARKEHKH